MSTAVCTTVSSTVPVRLALGSACTHVVNVGVLVVLQLNDALADKPSELLDYSLKQEQTRLLVVGHRIAKCMAK